MRFKALPVTSLEDATVDFEQLQTGGVDRIGGTLVPLKAAWIAPTLATNWSNVGGSSETAGYFKDPLGFVHLRGVIVKSLAWVVLETVFTLPAGFRPGANGIYTGFLWDNTNGFLTAAWNVRSSGTVLLDSIPRPGTPGIANEATLSGISFLAEN